MITKRFLTILHARNIEFIRDKSALSWNIILPVILVLGFAFIFSGEQRDIYKVGTYGTPQQAAQEFLASNYVQFIPVENLQKAITRVEHHQLDMLLNFDANNKYWVNSSSPNGYVLERMLWASLGQSNRPERQMVSGREIRYVDWVVPGILAMNMMFSCLFGIGYVIVRYRKNGVLKRLKATPLSAFEFISAQIVSRFFIIMTITTLVFVGCDIFIDFYMLGSYLTLFLVFSLGSLCLIALGLIMATRTKSEEFAGGVLNMVTWPMMILSGVWFSLEGTNSFMQGVSKALPLTHIIDAARAVMNDGATLVQIGPQLLILGLMTLAFLVIGAITFRWD